MDESNDIMSWQSISYPVSHSMSAAGSGSRTGTLVQKLARLSRLPPPHSTGLEAGHVFLRIQFRSF